MPCIDLDCIQDSIANVLSGTAYILTPSTSLDSLGGGTVTYGTAGTASCYVASLGRPIEQVVGEQILSVPGFSILLPYGTAIQANYRLVSDGWTYEVAGHNRGETLAVLVEATCYRVGDT